MRKATIPVLILALAISVFGGKIHRSLLSASGDSVRAWVFFSDKNLEGKSVAAEARRTLSNRALNRRAENGVRLDEKDVPVSDEYIAAVESLGGRPLRESRWLNGASFMIPTASIRRIAELEFVTELRPVTTYRRKPLPAPRGRIEVESEEDAYGASRLQLEMLGAVTMHELGYRGEGVLVGMLDSGFRLTHVALESTEVIATYDFIHDDETVDFDTLAGDDDAGGFKHGTQTLSCIAADYPGYMMGVAPEAVFALAKTEDVDSEYVAEEDNWVAGMEWLDSVGVDIISSSLGYSVFDADTPYSFSDLDGNTCITTRAADAAASRGICVVNSAGNERGSSSWPHLVAPSDGDSVLAAAAVGRDRLIAPFSSPGPTADGRIKPDCSALGYGTVLVNAFDTTGVVDYGSGTSFSCPLLAGLCALVKSANPSLSGYELAMAVRGSGDRRRAFDPSNPTASLDSADNDYGWGIPKAPVAAGLHEGFYARILDQASDSALTGLSVQIIYEDGIRSIESDTFGLIVDPLADSGDTAQISVDGYNISAPIPVDGTGRAIRLSRLGSGRSIQLFPNPAEEYLTAVAYGAAEARISVYSSDGNLVFDESWSASVNPVFRWNLENQHGRDVANGIYLIRLATESVEIIRKIAVVR